MTDLPNQMALGATWNPTWQHRWVRSWGKSLPPGSQSAARPIAGYTRHSSTRNKRQPGNARFGGDPYWVSEMGRAYVRGVHQGGNGRLATVAKRFPGNGSSDRVPEEEVATVRKSLDELDKFDLVPFYAVTGTHRILRKRRRPAHIPHPLPGPAGQYSRHNSPGQF